MIPRRSLWATYLTQWTTYIRWRFSIRPKDKPKSPPTQQDRFKEQIFLHASGRSPNNPLGAFQDSFSQAQQAIEKSHLEMQRQQRLFLWLLMVFILCGIGFTGFICWCVYFVLKAKGLVP